MDLIGQVVLSSIFWVPALIVLYWVIRLAVRHAMEDAFRVQRMEQRAEQHAAAVEAERARRA